MKKIWICGVYHAFDVGLNKSKQLYKFNFNFAPESYEPITPIPLNKRFDSSLELFKYLPKEADFILSNWESTILRWTDSEELIKREWFTGVINIIKHLKDLDSHGLVKIDHEDLNKNLPIFLNDLENHRIKFPELWI